MADDSQDGLPKAYEPSEVEARWYARWKEARVFRAEATSSKPPYCIILPPPNVTGSLHIGHALTATLEDILIRWHHMRGFNTLWQPGVDHAGIATQLVVEREVKKTEGKARLELGRAEFVKRIWAWKDRYGARITEQHEHLGASLDWSRDRFTLDPGSSRAVLEAFVRLYEEGLIYRAQRLINWCPDCRTALSDLEVEHEERQGSIWEIRYPVKGQNRFLVVATTRPETMLGDTAVAVHPDDERYRDLIGKTVVLPLMDREIPVIADAQLVDPKFGTGVVKVTPGHDENDYQTGLRHQLPMISLLDEGARMTTAAGAYAGLDRFEARTRVLVDLEAKGLLVSEQPHKYAIGLCQRSGTVVEPMLSPQWFVKIGPLAKPALDAVLEGKTRIYPESWKATYVHWMEIIRDWCVSRQLWWGHQIPAWYCEACSARTPSGGIDLAEATPIVARSRPPHCPKCQGSQLVQDPDVLDTWFSSGLWPFSTLGWPEQTPELKTFYPGSVLETGHDILFFWVARMMMLGIHFMGEVPFRDVYLHAMVRDEKGEKMSKVKGNVIDPLDVIHGATAAALPPALRNKFPQGMPAFGADALRYTLAAFAAQGREIRLSLDRVAGYKAFTNKLWNASRFLLLNLGDFRPDGRPPTARTLTLADRWILSRLERVTAEANAALGTYQFADAASALYQFTWREFCDWYIELAKPVLTGPDPEAKEATRTVLVHVLERLLRLLHPFIPFVTEEIWHRLPGVAADAFLVQARYPEAGPEDPRAEAEMAPVVEVIEGIRNIRGESNLPPLQKIRAIVQSDDAGLRAALDRSRNYVVPLAGLSELVLQPVGAPPPGVASWVGQGVSIYVPLAGLLDLDEERARLRKEIARVESDLAALIRKLDNPSFVSRAPADVVEKDRARVTELQGRLAKLQDNLSRI